MPRTATIRSGKPAKTPYHRGNVAEDLLKAAARILETERFEDLSARRLCREIGVTSANFYNHFPSLEHLLMELAADGFELRAQQNRRILARPGTREDKLVEVAVNAVEFAVQHTQLFRIMFGQVENGPAHERSISASNAAFGVLVQIVYGEDRYRPDDIAWSHENCQAGYAFFSFSYGLARMVSVGLIYGGKRAERLRFVTDVTRTFLRGLAGLPVAKK